MSSTQSGPDTGRSAGLTLNLSSNNPFRNRAASPSSPFNTATSPTAVSPFDDPLPPPRPVSRNPFLEPNVSSSQPNLIDISNSTMATKFDSKASPTAEELFDTLTLEDPKPARGNPAPLPPSNRPPPPPNRENKPPVLRGPHPAHSPPRSREEALRRKMEGNNGRRPRVVSNSRSPQRRAERRPRRNSESSVLDIEKPLTEEEKKAREARRRERERRHRENKEKKPNRRLDIIDQLDHTSLFGSGFHHDGPFDAVNPHRNRKGSRRAPMQAFPKDSLNMSLGGSGPLNKTADHSTFMGMANDEAFKEYAGGAKNGLGYTSKEAPVFDPRMRTAMHGEESLGLGTSTFLEGTPAPRTAIQKQVAEQAEQMASEGLQRKKSLAQRIRNINRPQRDVGPSGRLTNPEGVYARTSPDFVPSSTSTPQYSTERNPFFNEDHKEPESHMLHRAHTGTMSPTSPPPRPASQQGVPLERRVTSDATSPTEDGSGRQSGGFLSRVKSLKGGRRNRQSSDNLAPGTAV